MDHLIVETGLTAYHWGSTVGFPAMQGFAAEYPEVWKGYLAITITTKLWMLYALSQRPRIKNRLKRLGIVIP